MGLVTDGLLTWAFVLRVIGLAQKNPKLQEMYKLNSFQVLSCVAPLIWMSESVRVVMGEENAESDRLCVCVQRLLLFWMVLSILEPCRSVYRV